MQPDVGEVYVRLNSNESLTELLGALVTLVSLGAVDGSAPPPFSGVYSAVGSTSAAAISLVVDGGAL